LRSESSNPLTTPLKAIVTGIGEVFVGLDALLDSTTVGTDVS